LPAFESAGVATQFEVTNETTLNAARRLVADGLNPVALNFASVVPKEAVQAAGLGPIHPGGEMLRLDGVAVHEFAGEVAVDGVEIQAMAAGQKLVDEIEVAAKLVEGAGLAGVVAGGLDATPRESGVGFFKAADIVALPAMQGNGCAREGGEGGLDIHAEGGVGGAGGAKGGG
jgi:hypothetical protein